jgi:hypothetical protein
MKHQSLFIGILAAVALAMAVYFAYDYFNH